MANTKRWTVPVAIILLTVLCGARVAAQELEDLKKRVDKIEAALKVVLEKDKSAPTAVAEKKKEAVDFESFLGKLRAGNDRFMSGKPARKDLVKRRQELTAGQHPYAIVVCCSDSRVPPELFFDETLGQLFVIRTAGNVVDSVAIGSIEYAVEHLHAPLLVVLGHTSCGAVTAAAAGGTVPAHLPAIVQRLAQAVDAGKKKTADAKELVGVCVSENVKVQIERLLKESPIVHEAAEKKEIMVTGGVYHLDSGKVEFMEAAKSDIMTARTANH